MFVFFLGTIYIYIVHLQKFKCLLRGLDYQHIISITSRVYFSLILWKNLIAFHQAPHKPGSEQ